MAGNRALSLVEVNPSPTPNAGFPSDLLDLYGEAMDQALGIEKASLSAMVEMNSCALDTCERLAGDLFGVMAGVFASCVQAQLSWLMLLVPRVYESTASPTVAAPAGALDHSMDIVIGAGSGDSLPRTALSMAEGGSFAGQAPERSMDLAIGDVAA
jgi:hypothetical protein